MVAMTKNQGLRALKSTCFPGRLRQDRSGFSTGIGSESQISKSSASTTRKISRFSHRIRNAPGSMKGLSSHTIPRQTALAASHPSTIDVDCLDTSPMVKPPPLSLLPLISLVRGVFTSSISSSPILLPLSLRVMSVIAHSRSPLLNPDRNPLLRWGLKHSFYAQFCAGETAAEVRRTVSSLKSWGCTGVMLCYAKEAELEETGGEKANSDASEGQILPWKKGTLETVAITAPGDFVALKFTGAGSQVLQDLAHGRTPSPAMHAAITEICDLAASRSVRLLFDAEAALLQPGVDDWTIEYMQRYNNRRAIIYCTYQAYLKRCPQVLSSHLAIARRRGFKLGIKLVRGAYLASDPRELIHNTKADTDNAYDSIAESVMRRQYGNILHPAAGEEATPFPEVALVLAGHNLESARKAMSIRSEQVGRGERMIEMEYAQLQGMADEVSCELVQASRAAATAKAAVDAPQVYKYLVWGTTGECLKYLLRRAQENKDAMQRTREGRDAMAGELWRRFFGRT